MVNPKKSTYADSPTKGSQPMGFDVQSRPLGRTRGTHGDELVLACVMGQQGVPIRAFCWWGNWHSEGVARSYATPPEGLEQCRSSWTMPKDPGSGSSDQIRVARRDLTTIWHKNLMELCTRPYKRFIGGKRVVREEDFRGEEGEETPQKEMNI